MSNLQSFPSGHSSTAFILAIGLAITFPKARWLFFVFAILACGQRIGFQAHYLSDVWAGVLLALVMFSIYLVTPFGRKGMLGDVPQFPVVEEWSASQAKAEISKAA